MIGSTLPMEDRVVGRDLRDTILGSMHLVHRRGELYAARVLGKHNVLLPGWQSRISSHGLGPVQFGLSAACASEFLGGEV